MADKGANKTRRTTPLRPSQGLDVALPFAVAGGRVGRSPWRFAARAV
jgi:hypothetical protein